MLTDFIGGTYLSYKHHGSGPLLPTLAPAFML